MMISYRTPVRDTEATGDTFDRILAIAWIASDIAIDVFGMLFWAGLALCLMKLVTQ